MKNSILTFFIICFSVCYAGNKVASAFLWDASTDTLGRVLTGSPEETSGYWYDYNDEYDEGQSHFIWPSDVKENDMENFYGSLVQMYEGIQGSFVLIRGNSNFNPHVGLGFNIWSESQEGVDITEWGGLCVEYRATRDFYLMLHEEDNLGTDLWGRNLKLSEKMKNVDIPWNDFRQIECCAEYMKLEYTLAKSASIKIVFTGPDSANGDFKITKIGSLGTCDGSVPVEPVAMPRAASVPKAQFRKIPEGFEILNKSLVGKPYMLFDLNGGQIQSGSLPAVVKAPTTTAILRVSGQTLILR